jgi:hypothetical protein
MQKMVWLLMVMLAIAIQATAQQKVYDNLYKVRLKDVGPIMNGDVVRGYYTVYLRDKESKTEMSYTLDFMDENLKIVKSQKLKLSKYSLFLDAVFNGNNIYIAILDRKSRIITVKVNNNNGELKGTYKTEVIKSLNMAQLISAAMNDYPTYFFGAIDDKKGVVINVPFALDKDKNIN